MATLNLFLGNSPFYIILIDSILIHALLFFTKSYLISLFGLFLIN